MKVLFLTKESPYWKKTIEYASKVEWKAGPVLSRLMEENKFSDFEKVVILLDEDTIKGFCTITNEDCIKNLEYTPYIGFLYIDINERGNRYSKILIDECSKYAFELGFKKIYLTSDHIGLYEKYGFTLIGKYLSIYNNEEQLFEKELKELYIPQELKNIVSGLKYQQDYIGRSKDTILIYESKYVLKISKDIEQLKTEKEMNDFLENKIPSAKSIYFTVENNLAYYLRTYINGYSLIDEKFINDPNRLIKTLKGVIDYLAKLDNYPCNIYSKDNTGINFVHGDLCLPNIYVNEYDDLIGFIDLGNAGLGDRYYDISWLLWSLEYNLKTNKYNNMLLEMINMEFNEAKYKLYIPYEYRLVNNNQG